MSALGLTRVQRAQARQRVKKAALHVASQRAGIHYTQGARRWDFIRGRCAPWQRASYADCSALSSWLLWTGTARVWPRMRDFVNGAGWRAGYTGTMIQHGVRIPRPTLIGDCVFYGGTRGVPAHVALYIGNGLVVSHGSEAGPMILRWNYRPVNQTRRYIR